ncbi:Rad52/Rad22 family DNA repair protein [Paenibacillus abyssi]|uniref:Uncharacterized protein n=1 Tax=Paenibacillus abyssi TaxID=1340531 RepID=A0A917LFF7_9BACL|nr:Rad52/Rad22 family DNA repair protein [Paenibacillus abyssi]GGG18589.1 hypothetical protein GCM10010916_39250 [Paenibacillus abyssi]
MSSTTTETNLSVLLNKPFPYEAYGVNFEGQAYVGIQWVVDRLNEVVGPLNWKHDFFDVTENLDDNSVEVLGRLSIWDEIKQTWMERTNYGNDTMTILKGETAPTAQDRMDCKKSAVSDSLKKCAAWFGVASDVFKTGVIDTIKPKKSDGSDNPLYQKLVDAHAVVNRFGTHKHGITILPESYRSHYKEKNWQGIFQSDIQALFSRSSGSSGGTAPAGKSSSQPSILPQETAGEGAGESGAARSGSNRSGNSSRGRSNNGSNKPEPIRMKVLDAPKFNQDGTSTFKAKLENNSVVIVFAGKELGEQVKRISPDAVINTSGWIKDQKVTLAVRGGKIEVEAA